MTATVLKFPPLLFNKTSARKQLQALDPSTDRFTFQTFDDVEFRDRPPNEKGKYPKRGDKRLVRILHGTLDEHWDELCELNRQGAGIYVTVNATNFRGRKEEHIVEARAFMQDDDEGHGWLGPTKYPCIEMITSRVRVGDREIVKAHRMMLIYGVPLTDWDTYQTIMCDRFGCDPSAKDRSRVLRVAGTYNMKDPANPFRVKLTVAESVGGSTYDADEVRELFAPYLGKTAAKTSETSTPGSGGEPGAYDDAPVMAKDKDGIVDDVRAFLFDNSVLPLATMLHDLAPDVIRSERSRGGYVIECAFEQEHTTTGGEGCFVDNAHGGNKAIIKCMHSHCAHRTKWTHLAGHIEAGHLSWVELREYVREFDDISQDPAVLAADAWCRKNGIIPLSGPRAAIDAPAAPEATTPTEWLEPDWSLLDDRRGELPTFPLDVLPEAWQRWAETAAAGAGVTVGHIMAPVFAVASSLIGAGRFIKPDGGWLEPFTLWTGLLGFSGSGKTPSFKVSTRALAAIEATREVTIRAEHKKKLAEYKTALALWEIESAKCFKNGEPIPGVEIPRKPAAVDDTPTIPRLYVTDSSVEKLAVLAQERPQGLLMLNDELTALFANLSRNHRGSDRPFWLDAWNANRHVVTRMSRDTITVEHLAIGLTGGLQPDKLQDAFGDSADGFHARFLFAWPEKPPFRPLTGDQQGPDPAYHRALARLADLPFEEGEAGVPLSQAARTEFDTFRRQVYDQLDALPDREQESWAKMPGHALRIAGTLCFMNWAWSGRDDEFEPLEIGLEYLKAATRLLLTYYWPHGKAAVRQIGLTPTHANGRRVVRWLKAQGPLESVGVEALREHALSRRLESDGTKELLADLVKRRWLRELPKITTGGRPMQRWAVNPALYRQRD